MERLFYCGLFSSKSLSKNIIKNILEDYEAKVENIYIDDEHDNTEKEIQKNYPKMFSDFFAPIKQYNTYFLANWKIASKLLLFTLKNKGVSFKLLVIFIFAFKEINSLNTWILFVNTDVDIIKKFYNEYIIAISCFLLNKYEENDFFFHENSKQVILNISRGINNGI